jgi:hypothetical protein
VKDRCQVIMLYEQANKRRQFTDDFSEAKEKADAALSAGLEKYGSKTSSIFSSIDDRF